MKEIFEKPLRKVFLWSATIVAGACVGFICVAIPVMILMTIVGAIVGAYK
jgi:hypothetical protein